MELPIMIMSTTVESLFPALIKAQSQLKNAIKSAENPHFKSKYADLGAVWDAAKEALSTNNLAALQDAVCDENGLAVNTRIIHSSGEWIDFASPTIPLDKRSAHGIGSALTYGRRYSLSTALGIVADVDDDGNAAVSDAQETACITEDQADKLFALMKESKANKSAFLKYLGVEFLDKIPAAKYNQAVQALSAKIKKGAENENP
jgi:hypothetical protein